MPKRSPKPTRRRPAPASGPSTPDILKLYHAGRLGEARSQAMAALQRSPNDTKLLASLAMTLDRRGAHDVAIPYTQRAVRLNNAEPLLHSLHGTCLRMTGRTEEALESYDNALRLEPANGPALAGKVRLLLALKRPDDAEKALEPHLGDAAGSHQITLAAVRLRQHQRDHAAALELIEARLPHATTSETYDLMHQKAGVLDAMGRYDEAYATITSKPEFAGRFDPDKHRAMTERAVESLTPEAFGELMQRAAAAYRPKSPTPLFILGPPRSGTTLAERILARHPRVHAGGEQGATQNTAIDLQPISAGTCPVPFAAWDTLTKGALGSHTRRYRKEMPKPPAGSTADFVTDKLPGNVLHIPMLKALFPDAPIVYCERDPRDTAVSCLLRQFAPGLAWTERLSHIQVYLEDCRRIVEHARDTLGIDVITLNYERLASEPEAVVPELLERLGLEPCEDCLTPQETEGDARTLSAEQVNKPINTGSVRRWKNYRSHIERFFDVSE